MIILENSSTTDSGDIGTVSESDSGKSSPGTLFPDHPNMLRENINNILNVTSTVATTTGNTTTIPSNSSTQQQQLKTTEQMEKQLISDHSLESATVNGLIENSELTSLYNDKLNGLKINSNLADASGNLLIH